MFHPDEFYLTRVSTESKSIQPVRSKTLSERSEFFATEGQVASYIKSFGSDMGFFHAHNNFSTSKSQIHHREELGSLDSLHCHNYSPIKSADYAQVFASNRSKNRQSFVCPSSSFEVLRQHRSRCLKFDAKTSGMGNDMQSHCAVLPTEMVIQLAAEKFIQSTPQRSNNLSVLNHPYPSSVLGHTEEDSRVIQLVQNLLSCAEKVGEKQHERAIKFLKECDKLSSPTGSPVQRLVFYFSEALYDKIFMETGRIVPVKQEMSSDPLDPVICSNMLIAFHKEHPHSQISKFAGIQAIVDHLEEARKVHVIDFQVRSGVQWIIFMQALAARKEHPVQYLKLTCMGTKAKSMLEDTGRQLANFAESLGLKFIFKLSMVESFFDLQEDHFELDDDEAVAVYTAYTLMSLIGKINQIEHVMEVIRSISPRVMVVTELEANCNAPTFVDRFVESLFFFGAFFDSLAHCFKDDETNRGYAESTWFRSSIRNVLAAEGEERKVRHVNINVWRAFFSRFGLVEVELSVSAMDQATVVLQGFTCKTSCTLHIDGKSLIMGWKGTPLNSLSVWKFK